jgi:hypothetical protein
VYWPYWRAAQLPRPAAPRLPHADSLDEVSQFGQTPGHIATGEHGGQDGETKARRAQLTGEQRYHPPHAVQPLPIVPHGIVRHAQEGLGDDLDVERATGGGQREGALPRRYGTVMFAYDREIIEA